MLGRPGECPVEDSWLSSSAGSILDISKYRDTCERSISILDGIAILRYIEWSDDTWTIFRTIRGIVPFDT